MLNITMRVELDFDHVKLPGYTDNMHIFVHKFFKINSVSLMRVGFIFNPFYSFKQNGNHDVD